MSVLRYIRGPLISRVGSRCLLRLNGPAVIHQNRSEHSSEQFQSKEQLRKARLVAVMVGSAVGFLGGLYVLYGKMTKVKAKADEASGTPVQFVNDDATEQGSDEDDGKKRKKAKYGFRDRRVRRYTSFVVCACMYCVCVVWLCMCTMCVCVCVCVSVHACVVVCV